MSEPATGERGVGPSVNAEDIDRLLAVVDELATLFKTEQPGAGSSHAHQAHFLCRCLVGIDRHVDSLIDEIERLAPGFFSLCSQARRSGSLETLREVITGDLLYHVRVRLVLLQRWKSEERRRLAS